MSPTSVSIVDLLGIVGAGQDIAPAGGGGKENFQALLDLGGGEAAEDSSGGGESPVRDRRKDIRLPDMAAAPAELAASPLDKASSDKSDTSSDIAPTKVNEASGEDYAAETSNKGLSGKASTPTGNDTPNNPTPPASDGSAPETSAVSNPVVEAAVAAPPAEATLPDPFPGRQWLGGIGRLRQALAHLMAALRQQFQPGKSQPQPSTPGAPDPFASLIAALELRLGGGLPDAASAGTILPAVEPSQLAMLHDLLAHMRGAFVDLVKSAPRLSAAIEQAAVKLPPPANIVPMLEHIAALEKGLNKLGAYLAHVFPGTIEATELIAQALAHLDALRKVLQPPMAGDLPVTPEAADMKPLKPLSAFAGIGSDDKRALETLPVRNATAVAPALPAGQAPDAFPAANSNSVSSSNAAVQGVVPAAFGQAGGEAGANTGGGAQHHNGNAPLTAASLSAAPASPAPGKTDAAFARMLSQAQSAPVAEQVVLHIRSALADGSSRIRIQLEPAELGRMDIRLHVAADGKTGVQVTVDSRDTLLMLQRDARGLEQALADAGLKADGQSLSFNLRGEQDQGDSSQAALTYRKYSGEEEEAPPEIVSGKYIISLSEGLDIII